MAEKAFFGASKSEVNRFKNEVYKDCGMGKVTPKKKRAKSRRKSKR